MPKTLANLKKLNLPTENHLVAWEAIDEMVTVLEHEYHTQLLNAAPFEFAAYCEYLFPEEPPTSALHQFFCGVLTKIERRETMRLICSVPPGHAKSTYFSRLFPTWYLGRNYDHKYIQAGHTTSFCESEFGKKNRAIITSERYQEVFPDIKLSAESKAAGAWSLATPNGKRLVNLRGQYLTRGMGQGISGYRANIAAVDDPFASREDAESEVVRQKVYDWFTDDLSTRLLPNSPVFVVATRWHEDDLCGRLEERSKEDIKNKTGAIPYEVINFPAFAEDDDDPLGRAIGEPLWPEFFDADYLNEKKATLAPRGWNSLYCGRPVDVGGGVLKSEWISRYKTLPTRDDKVVIRRITVSVDSAIKATERHDWTVLTVWAQTGDGRHCLLDVVRRRVEFNELVKLTDQVASFWQATAILVEDKGSGTQYIQVRGQNSATPSPVAVVPISVQNLSKEFRFDAVTPMFSQGLVLLPENSSWLALYERELLMFPAAKYDDQVDSTSQYLEWARGAAKIGTRKLRVT